MVLCTVIAESVRKITFFKIFHFLSTYISAAISNLSLCRDNKIYGGHHMFRKWYKTKMEAHAEKKRIHQMRENYKEDAANTWSDLVKQYNLLLAIGVADESVRNTLNAGGEENIENYDYEAISNSNSELLADISDDKNEHYKKSVILRKSHKVFDSIIAVIALSVMLVGMNQKDLNWLKAAEVFTILAIVIKQLIIFFSDPGKKETNNTIRRNLEKWQMAFIIVAKRKHTSIEQLAFYLSLYYDGIKVTDKKEIKQNGLMVRLKKIFHWLFVDKLELSWRFLIASSITSVALPGLLDFCLPEIINTIMELIENIKKASWDSIPLIDFIKRIIVIGESGLLMLFILSVCVFFSVLLVALIGKATDKVIGMIDGYFDIDDDYVYVKTYLFPQICRKLLTKLQ